jgi:hypothetical protein
MPAPATSLKVTKTWPLENLVCNPVGVAASTGAARARRPLTISAPQAQAWSPIVRNFFIALLCSSCTILAI